MKTRTLKLLPLLLLAFLLSSQTAWSQAARTLQLDDGMPLIITPTVEISSASDETGQMVTFKIVHDCKVDGVVLIKTGAIVNGVVDKAVHSKMFGQKGVLEVSFKDVKAIDGTVLQVRATIENKGNMATTTKDKIAGMLPYGIGMLGNGKDAILIPGVPLTIFVNGATKFRITPGQTPKAIPVKKS